MKYTRICPKCGKTIEHTNMYNRNYAEQQKRVCISCGAANKWTDPSFKEKFKNTREKNISKYKTDEYKLSQSKLTSGRNNKMYGKKYYDIWVEKYGKEPSCTAHKI